ncbi:MAG: ABC-F family ATP-binding cassette domain-containing protein [Desulfotomaculum sp.]|nr:ABC-F family ATP-binding cassette domain-containing protein [Desulfotomaculum sp.]
MVLLQASHVTKLFGNNTILSDVTVTLQSGERAGLVGVNGAGKSTLLKIMAGEMKPDAGEVIKPKNVTIGYVSQHGSLIPENSIEEELLSVFNPLKKIENKLRELELALSRQEVLADENKYQQFIDEYSKLSEIFKEKGGYSYHSAVRSVMHGLNLNALGKDVKVKALSGGQKTLVALAKLLLQNPDVLMLDEPTNYLDINTLNWLEQYLKSFSGALLVVSHDRYMLNSLVNVIYELENSKVTLYNGNYSHYLEQKAKNIKQQVKEYKKQLAEINHMKEFIQKNIARAATSKRAQSRRRMLEKTALADPPQQLKKVKFDFNIKHRSGKEVLKVQNLSIGYENKIISSNINFLIERGESIALVGPNGAGKSTLLKTLIGKVKSLSGEIKFGSKVKFAYYEQEQAKLNSSKQVLQEVWDEYPQLNEADIRTTLGNFLFSGDDVEKNVCDLSGGEKARLTLAKVMLSEANFLILDEPTNHLDIFSREVLENALVDFPGTILFVSHDRYFINKIATRVLELSKQGVVSYLGDYDYYIYKKQKLSPVPNSTINSDKPAAAKQQKDKEKYLQNKEKQRLKRKRERRLNELEKYIKECEDKIENLEIMLCSPEIYQDYDKCLQINNELQELKKQLDQHYTEWLELEEVNAFE